MSSWQDLIDEVFEYKEEVDAILDEVNGDIERGVEVFPDLSDIFSFTTIPLRDVRYVVVGGHPLKPLCTNNADKGIVWLPEHFTTTSDHTHNWDFFLNILLHRLSTATTHLTFLFCGYSNHSRDQYITSHNHHTTHNITPYDTLTIHDITNTNTNTDSPRTPRN